MSIKVLADKVLAFDRGELDRNGLLVKVQTKIGFNELPDWVGQTDYFKAAQNDGSLKSFTSSADSEMVLKEQEKLAALKDEIKFLEEQRDLLQKTVSSAADSTSSEESKSSNSTQNTVDNNALATAESTNKTTKASK